MTLSRAQRARIARIARGRSDEPLRLLEGPKSVLEALRAGVVSDLWLRADLDGSLRDEIASAARTASVRAEEASGEDFERLGSTVTPQGVLALVRDVAAPLARVVESAGLLLWLDGVQDPGNVGAVVRVAAGLGASGVLAGSGTADPLGLKALRASAGLALRVPFARGTSAEIAAALEKARRPVWLLDAKGDDLFAAGPAPANLVLAVGGEGHGPGEDARAAAKRCVGIPLATGVESLNAAVAAGIAVALLSRRR